MGKTMFDIQMRSSCYSLLASLMLTEPDGETLGGYMDGLRELLEALGESYTPVGVGLSGDALLGACRQQYYDAFFVPKSGAYVPPYASSLRDYDPSRKKGPFGLLDPKAAARVQAMYDSVGFDPHALNIYAPWRQIGAADNIGFELAFMAGLCSQRPASEEEERLFLELQQRMLRDHLLPCLPNFDQALSRTDALLYSQTAHAAHLFAKQDLAALDANTK